jgi:PAS domain S-box-containing protein
MKVLLRAQTKHSSLFLYKKVFESSPYAIMKIKGKRVRDINRRFMDILKYDNPDELSNSNLSSLIHEEEIEKFFEQLKNIELDKSDHAFPYKFRCKDDNYINLVVHMILIGNNSEVALYCNTFS